MGTGRRHEITVDAPRAFNGLLADGLRLEVAMDEPTPTSDTLPVHPHNATAVLMRPPPTS